MARMLDDVLVPVRLEPPEVTLGDDEIAAHLEALEDGRDAPVPGLWPFTERQDDEIASHLELEESIDVLPLGRGGRRRRPVRH